MNKFTNLWKVSYMMNGTSYQERVEVGEDLSYYVAAMVAMDMVRTGNSSQELTDMTAQRLK